MESLLQQHTYARSPLRAYTDGDYEDPFKAHFDPAVLKGLYHHVWLPRILKFTFFSLLWKHTCCQHQKAPVK